MARRLWEYNVQAYCQYGLPVLSVVIYLTPCQAAVSPYRQRLPMRENHRFYFDVIRLCDVPTHELRAVGSPAVLPLLTLTRDGARRETVEEVISALAPVAEATRNQLLYVTYVLASLVFTKAEDSEWLKERFAMLEDVFQESWLHREFMQRLRERIRREAREEGLKAGREEGLKAGREEGLKAGREEGLKVGREEGLKVGREEGLKEAYKEAYQEVLRQGREMLLEIVRLRFPEELTLARQGAEAAQDFTTLRQTTLAISLAQDVQEVRRLLLNLSENSH
jgi:predicted transposase YdaD